MQLDDLSAYQLERVKPVSFLIVTTSPGNHQAWIAVTGEINDREDFSRRLRKGAGADPTASGATRVAGTANFKRKYESSFPTVHILEARPGLTITTAELEALNLVAPPEPVPRQPITARVSRRGPRRWPSYERCLQRAPKTHKADRPDVSRADFTWCMTAFDWGWSVEEIAARLMAESSKARQNGRDYALNTAANAAAAVKRRRGDSSAAATDTTSPSPPDTHSR